MIRLPLLAALLIAAAPPPPAAVVPQASKQLPAYRDRLPEDDVIYFLLPDRFDNGDPANDKGGLTGDRLKTGYDPSAKGFYHGGDLKGVLKRLDYIQHLGVTAIWVAPISRTSRFRARRARNRPAITAIGSPILPRSTRISAPMPISRRWSTRRTRGA